ncbi:MAG: ABC transporter permease [Chloroflexi bacterium CFX4]|nr:ABC transporter permease [Chloroflexi bacterium CFX4]MDL1923166.1 ABC transporter permease [Chloroflexi bacterium CFX3]
MANNVVVLEGDALGVRRRSQWRYAARRFFANPLAIVGMVIVTMALACAFFAPIIAPYEANWGDLGRLYVKPPSPEHPLGTDDVGRDIYSRIIYGAQISLKIALFSQALGVLIGTALGLIAGYYGGFVDSLIMRFVDVFMAFPLLIIAIALVAVLGSGENNLIIGLAAVIWPGVSRLVRAQVLMLKETEYVSAARLIGVRDGGIMLRHILPNLLTPLIVFATLGTAGVILSEAALSFLGLGTADATTPSWGKMLAESRAFIRSAWWMPFYPGMTIFLVVLGFNLLGDGLRDALDVRAR